MLAPLGSGDGARGLRSCGTFGRWAVTFLAVVPRFKMSSLGQAKRFKRSVSVHGYWLGDQAHVVAALIQQRASPRSQPMGALLKHRRLAWARPDRQAGELIGAIAGESAEPLGQPQVSGGEEMNSQISGPERHPVGVVGLGQPHAIPRRLDAGLAVKPTRQPAFSCAWAAVTTTSGVSSADMMAPNPSSDIAVPLPPDEPVTAADDTPTVALTPASNTNIGRPAERERDCRDRRRQPERFDSLRRVPHT
jgi:hypothetical protein